MTWMIKAGNMKRGAGDAAGTLSIVSAFSFNSCSHGAGRAMRRTRAKRTFTLPDQIKTTEGVAGFKPIKLCARGMRSTGYAESVIAGVPLDVATRALDGVNTGLGRTGGDLHVVCLAPEYGPGNVLLATIVYEHGTAVFADVGEKSVCAEVLARTLVGRVRRYIAFTAVADEYLADQLMEPFALAGGGNFTADKVSQRASTKAGIIERLLPVRIIFTKADARSICAATPACPA